MSQEQELLPCPFCLGPADITSVVGGDEGDGYVWHVFCAEENDCAMMPEKYAESERTARQWWNYRAPQWQPVETAPKDGTLVLLWWPYWRQRAVIGYYATLADRWQSSEVLYDAEPPTHWMPLPLPPETAP